ncbi:MAG: DUF6798 domain-containing protein, partial [Planctomycetaceae bacterium]
TGESGDGGTAGWARAVAECAVVTAVFAAAAAWPAPDVNEAVYLTKARHAADPDWGRGDFFLETPDAHGIFYLVAGPLAASLPLPQAAWVGRVAGWALLAIGFRQATVPLISWASVRVLAALLFSFALRNTTAAGEWVIGGCEAKVFAWAAALGCIGAVGVARFPEACLRGGIATAFHPIVGGWTLVATLVTWLVELRRPAAMSDSSAGTALHKGWKAAALMAGGAAAAAAGLVPALGLTAGVDAATRAAATKIYVVERLSHHLLPRTFADGMIARHLLAAAAWWLLSRVVSPTPSRRRVAVLTWASLGISAAGIAISLLEPWAPTITYSLLRYYWFRLADVMVPFALATAFAEALSCDAACGRLTSWRPAWLRAAVVGLLAVDLAVQSLHWPLPGRTAVTARADSKVAAVAWADICDWVRDHAPADACFLTPRGAASFTWRTGLREVVSWKNSPQDAASLVAWRQRIVDCFSRSGSLVEMERSTASLGPERLREVAERYGADHAIVPLDAPLVDAIPGERLHANGTYAVYRLTPP